MFKAISLVLAACVLFSCTSQQTVKENDVHYRLVRQQKQQKTAAAPKHGIDMWFELNGVSLALAQELHKNVVVYFYATWCEACERMTSDVLDDIDVRSEIITYFVPTKVDIDKSDIDNHIGLRNVPTIVVMTPKGDVLYVHEGFVAKKELLSALKTNR